MRALRLLIPALALTAAAAAGEVSVSAAVEPPSIAMGQTAQLSVTIEGAEAAARPQIPQVPGIRISPGGTMQSTQIINGRVSRSLTFTYTVIPLQEGTHRIPPIEVNVGGRTYKTQGLSLSVGKGQAGGQLRLWVSFEPQQVYIYQPITAKVVLGASRPLADGTLDVPWLPDLEGFVVRAVPPGRSGSTVRIGIGGRTAIDAIASQKTIDGVPHDTYEFSVVLVPLSPGRYEIPPCTAQAELVVGYRRGTWPFYEKQAVTRTCVASSEAVTLVVSPLPEEGKPQGFSGGVGQFDLKVSADPASVKVGDPITVKCTVTGNGYVDVVSLPPLQSDENFKAYSQEAEIDSSVKGGVLTGTKTFTQALVPLSDKVTEIPAVTLWYFDPQAGEYRSVHRGPVPIEVSPAPQAEERPVVEAVGPPGKKAVEQVGADIFDIVPDAPATAAGDGLPPLPAAAAALLAPPLAYAAAATVARRRRRLREDVTLARATKAYRNARSRLAGIASLPEEEAPDAAVRILADYVADKLGRPHGEITAEEMRSALQPRVGAEQADRAAECVHLCDLARFGGERVDVGEIVRRVSAVIADLERRGL